MNLIASQPDFEPANPEEGATALYYQPADGSGYRIDFPYFQARFEWLTDTYPPEGQSLAIWGCCFGTFVKMNADAGYDVYGFDASAYAINRSNDLLPEIKDRVFQRDALDAADVIASQSDARLSGQFDLLITADMLTCMNDEEIRITLPLLRGVCSSTLIHVVTPLDPDSEQDSRLNWKNQNDWKTLLMPDFVYDAVTNQVI